MSLQYPGRCLMSQIHVSQSRFLPFKITITTILKNIYRPQLVSFQKLTFLELIVSGLGILTVIPLFNPLHVEYLPLTSRLTPLSSAFQKPPVPFHRLDCLNVDGLMGSTCTVT